MIEMELQAAYWAMTKCRLYLLGLQNFKLIVDHQPLVTILDKYTLDAVENPRLQRIKERMAAFTFTTVWRKGKEHAIRDALSRAPISDPTPTDWECEAEIVQHIRSVVVGTSFHP